MFLLSGKKLEIVKYGQQCVRLGQGRVRHVCVPDVQHKDMSVQRVYQSFLAFKCMKAHV